MRFEGAESWDFNVLALSQDCASPAAVCVARGGVRRRLRRTVPPRPCGRSRVAPKLTRARAAALEELVEQLFDECVRHPPRPLPAAD